MRAIRSALLASTFLFTSTAASTADVNVVASIKPVHSLVASVMQGVSEPSLLVKGAGSPHTYSLKPSQAKELQAADIVFWMSHDLEAFLENSIESIAKNAKAVSLMDSHGLIKLNFREGGAFDAHDHGHDDHGDDKHDDHGHDKHDDHGHDKHAEHGDDKHDDHGHDKHAEHGDHAFEWAGVFDLSAGTYEWSFAKVGGEYADPAMKMVILQAGDIEESEELAENLLDAKNLEAKENNDSLVAKEKAYSLNLDDTREVTKFAVKISKDGKYAFFTEHMPFEFEADEHFFKDSEGKNVEPIAQIPDVGHHDEHAHHDEHGHDEVDPHVWLDPQNAKSLVHEIEEHLAKIDPSNAAKYEANAKAVMKKLDALTKEIEADLKPIRDRGYVVFHDAYQYFEKRFGVSAVGSITVSPEVLPGAERVSELRDKVKSLNASCVFSEPQFEPKLVKTITENTDAGTGVLDPLGANIKDGPELYFTLIRNMAKSLKDCLLN